MKPTRPDVAVNERLGKVAGWIEQNRLLKLGLVLGLAGLMGCEKAPQAPAGTGESGAEVSTPTGTTQVESPVASSSADKVRVPVGNATIGAVKVSGGEVSNASSVVAGMRAGFLRCYNKGLQEDQNMKGSVSITAKINSDGDVVSATPSDSKLSNTVTSCVAARVSSAQFAPLKGGGATLTIPVTFTSRPATK